MSGCPLDWGQGRLDAFFAEEVLFAREGLKEIAGRDAGLTALCRRAGERWLKRVSVRATVTNALRANGKLMISILSLSDFFQLIVTGEDCQRSKPFPDPTSGRSTCSSSRTPPSRCRPVYVLRLGCR